MAAIKVRATENGHDGVQYRSAGEQFEVSKDRLKDGSTWFVPAGKADVDVEGDADLPAD